ncbi:hypothetical protein DPMN_095128 [Dreissena polymorpha]|uniref:Uncharacterized protein n=1 Tax=Dreissena polymorpha TaxID=45954 RepID=A0A9D4R463_DREPO|nr:hypothetical protein DPMN_095128 [Dreissena polymorpha]
MASTGVDLLSLAPRNLGKRYLPFVQIQISRRRMEQLMIDIIEVFVAIVVGNSQSARRYITSFAQELCRQNDREVTGSIPTVAAFFRSPPKTPSTGSRPRKRTRERLYKP